MENKANNSTQNNTSAQSNGTETGGLGSMMGNLNLNNIPDMLKQHSGTVTKAISGLSTTQKVIGGALLVLGAGYLSTRSKGGWMNKMGGATQLMNSAKKMNKKSSH